MVTPTATIPTTSAGGYSVRQAINEREVYNALVDATKGYGGAGRFADRAGLSRQYVYWMLHGTRRISADVAEKLGYELKWVKKEKE